MVLASPCFWLGIEKVIGWEIEITLRVPLGCSLQKQLLASQIVTWVPVPGKNSSHLFYMFLNKNFGLFSLLCQKVLKLGTFHSRSIYIKIKSNKFPIKKDLKCTFQLRDLAILVIQNVKCGEIKLKFLMLQETLFSRQFFACYSKSFKKFPFLLKTQFSQFFTCHSKVMPITTEWLDSAKTLLNPLQVAYLFVYTVQTM